MTNPIINQSNGFIQFSLYKSETLFEGEQTFSLKLGKNLVLTNFGRVLKLKSNGKYDYISITTKNKNVTIDEQNSNIESDKAYNGKIIEELIAEVKGIKKYDSVKYTGKGFDRSFEVVEFINAEYKVDLPIESSKKQTTQDIKNMSDEEYLDKYFKSDYFLDNLYYAYVELSVEDNKNRHEGIPTDTVIYASRLYKLLNDSFNNDGSKFDCKTFIHHCLEHWGYYSTGKVYRLIMNEYEKNLKQKELATNTNKTRRRTSFKGV